MESGTGETMLTNDNHAITVLVVDVVVILHVLHTIVTEFFMINL